MVNKGKVIGHSEQAKPKVYGIDTVYVHTDIKSVPDQEDLFEYNEVQYTKDEYLTMTDDAITNLELGMAAMYETTLGVK